jgi:hypothetical protein
MARREPCASLSRASADALFVVGVAARSQIVTVCSATNTRLTVGRRSASPDYPGSPGHTQRRGFFLWSDRFTLFLLFTSPRGRIRRLRAPACPRGFFFPAE